MQQEQPEPARPRLVGRIGEGGAIHLFDDATDELIEELTTPSGEGTGAGEA